jgi:nitric oxide reductase large subunit
LEDRQPKYGLKLNILLAAFIAIFIGSFVFGRYSVALGELIKILYSRFIQLFGAQGLRQTCLMRLRQLQLMSAFPV